MRFFPLTFLRLGFSVMTTWSRPLFLCTSLVFLLILSVETAPVLAQADTGEYKNVLVFYDENDKLPGLAITDQGIRSTLASASSFKIDVYNENLDLSRFQGNAQNQLLSDYFRQKYSRKKIDVIIAVIGPSLDFLLEHAEEISPGTPIVFCGVDRREIESRTLRSNVTGVVVKRDFKGTLDVALRLQPNTRDVVFIAGTSDFDKRLTEQAVRELREYQDRLAFKYLTNGTLDELLTEVSQLPPNTIVLISTVFRDGAGQPYVPHDVVSLISQKANAPVYGFLDQYLGRGIVGGHLYSLEAHGKKAAELALRILEGQEVADIPIVDADMNLDMFDWRQLQRWGISETSLPEGSIIQFKEPTLWEEYRWYVVGLVTALVVETILIAWLLYLRLRRRQAETEAERVSGRLAEIVANVPGIVWESRTDPAINGRRTTFISDYVEKMLGYTPEEWLKQPPGFGLQLIPKEERERVLRESDEVVETGKEAISEYRWFTKDGRIRWVENYVSPLVDEEAGIVGLRGVALDVTDRKTAEEKARQTEERNTAIVTAIPDMLFLVSPNGVCIDYHVNDPRELLIPPEVFLGKHLTDLLPPELAEEFLEGFERASAEPGPQIIEYKLALGGTEKWFESRIVRTGSNFLNVVRDITELKRTQLEAQEISGRLISAYEDERARLARELHDDACQNLALLSIELELLERIPTTEGECIRSKLKVLSERASELSTDLRRMSHQLHPARLAHLGLAPAVRGFCSEMESAHALKVEFVDANVPPTLPESTSLNIYRIIQESLQNVVKHSRASEASVILSANGNVLHLTISDNGCGFDTEVAAPEGSLGLISLRERVRLLHGTISIDSRPNSGTRIEATIPL